MSTSTPDLTNMSADEKRDLLAQLLQRDSGPAVSNVAPAQRRLWFLRKLDDTVAWHHGTALRFRGELNVAALQQAFSRLLQRHEALRTVFVEANGQPLQTVQPAVPIAIPVIEAVSEVDGADGSGLAAITAREFAAPFDVATGPLIRVTIVRAGGQEHLVLVTVHQLVADRASLQLMVDQLVRDYAGLLAGADAADEPAESSGPALAEVLKRQRDWLAGDEAAAEIAFWRDGLTGVASLTNLADRPRPAGKTFRAVGRVLDTDERFAAGVSDLGRRLGVSRSTVLLAALGALLRRFSGPDFAVGVPGPGWRAEAGDVVGPLENIVPVRFDCAADPSFERWITLVDGWASAAAAHGRVPFETIVDEVAPPRVLSQSPLFQIAFDGERAAPEQIHVPGAVVGRMEPETGFIAVDLEATATWLPAGVRLRLDGNADLFGADSLVTLLDRLVRLVEAGLADPATPISRLVVPGPQERKELLVRRNDTTVPLDPAWTLHGLVERQVAATPDAVALRCGGVTLTYRELDGRANALAARLAQLGVGLESRVGVFADRRWTPSWRCSACSRPAAPTCRSTVLSGAPAAVRPRRRRRAGPRRPGRAGLPRRGARPRRAVRSRSPRAGDAAATGDHPLPPPRSWSAAATSRTSSTHPGRPGGRRASRSSTGRSSPRPPPAGTSPRCAGPSATSPWRR